MRRMPWAVYFWPGLPQFSRCGSWGALLLAFGGAALLNVTLLGSLVWDELIAPDLRILLWVSVGLVWGVSAGVSAWRDRSQGNRQGDHERDLFSEAQDFYLQGAWFETERVLTRLLRDNGRDVEARLMLATLLRHTKRLDEATRQLNILARIEGAAKWDLEIRREGELLAEARKNTITTLNVELAENGEG